MWLRRLQPEEQRYMLTAVGDNPGLVMRTLPRRGKPRMGGDAGGALFVPVEGDETPSETSHSRRRSDRRFRPKVPRSSDRPASTCPAPIDIGSVRAILQRLRVKDTSTPVEAHPSRRLSLHRGNWQR